MKRNTVRLTESQLHNVIKESVKTILNEIGQDYDSQYLLGRLAGRKDIENGIYGKGNLNDIDTYASKAANKTDNPDFCTSCFTQGYLDQQELQNTYHSPEEKREMMKKTTDFYRGVPKRW